VRGNNDAQTVQRYLMEINAASVQHKMDTVLIEENLAGPSLNYAEMYWQISDGSKKALPIRCFAYVDVNPEHDAERLKFIETVAVNRGVNIRLFKTVAEAESWLDGNLKTSQ
jgi:hypothetical protein